MNTATYQHTNAMLDSQQHASCPTQQTPSYIRVYKDPFCKLPSFSLDKWLNVF